MLFAERRRGLERLAQAYEADADRQRDFGEEIHDASWRSFGWAVLAADLGLSDGE